MFVYTYSFRTDLHYNVYICPVLSLMLIFVPYYRFRNPRHYAPPLVLCLSRDTTATKSPSTTLSTDTSSFEYHISSTRSMHDVAAVLRWGIRHLQLEGSSFGNDSRWYNSFFEAERNASYPSRAFSEQLVPLLPRPHLDLLNAALAIFSSLAAHAEANSSGGSKLSMLLGLWLLTSQRSESGDDWKSFYDRWERNGRILEHLFLAHIRFVSYIHHVHVGADMTAQGRSCFHSYAETIDRVGLPISVHIFPYSRLRFTSSNSLLNSPL
jgi:hypothetical protein